MRVTAARQALIPPASAEMSAPLATAMPPTNRSIRNPLSRYRPKWNGNERSHWERLCSQTPLRSRISGIMTLSSPIREEWRGFVHQSGSSRNDPP